MATDTTAPALAPPPAADDPPRDLSRSRTAPVGAWGQRGLRAVSLLGALALWQLLTATDARLWLRFDKLPSATEVAAGFAERLRSPEYYSDLVTSLLRVATGFGLAAVLGIALGVAVARSGVVAGLLGPLFEAVRPIPAIALVPIAILLFPTSEQGIVFITFVAAFFPVLVSTRHAVRALPPIWEDAVRTMGGSRWRVLRTVVLPGALPGVFGGLSVGVGVSWICVISAEMISGQYGVGYRAWQAYTVVDYTGVVVGMLSIGLLGWATAAAVEWVGRRATGWLPRELRRQPW
ncbi:ABC-type transporter [Carbonactinospora thermoautotrophica]|uniref:ABC-type transporter n=1 Tax=Carbonactinospora thermoautotrophica TaxID=1469144 RepID=A0A132MWF0_9ACTN|nr:ABC transporter permease [Carbonactinospora thermoautotrophica]KWX02144.1 ABC-type transporter [Carbonactinospora thermoautotrophica]